MIGLQQSLTVIFSILIVLFKFNNCSAFSNRFSSSLNPTKSSVATKDIPLKSFNQKPFSFSRKNQNKNEQVKGDRNVFVALHGKQPEEMDDKQPENAVLKLTPRRLVEGGLWLGLLSYTILFAPGKGDPTVAASDQALVLSLFENPSHPDANPIFYFIFNYLGVFPLVFTALLVPGATKQKPVPAAPFLSLSIFLGYFAVGPYLTLREYRPEVKEIGFPSTVTENKLFSLTVVAYLAYLIKVFLSYDLDLGAVQGYQELFSTSTLTHVSSLDCTILSLVIVDPIIEDMKRRDWFLEANPVDWAKAVFFALPVVGPPLYLLFRPALQLNNEE